MIIFFAPHLVEVDNFAPVIYKLSKQNTKSILVLYTNQVPYEDFRISFLKNLPHVTVEFIYDDLKNRVPEFSQRKLFLFFLSERIDGAQLKGGKCLFCTARVWDGFTDVIGEFAKEHGIPIISVPGFAETFTNYMQRYDSVEMSFVAKSNKVFANFDKIISPGGPVDRLLAKTFWDDKIVSLGSPRYCPEWIDIIRSIAPRRPLPSCDGNLRLAIFMRNRFYPVFWSELYMVFRVILRFPDVSLAIVPHMRSGDRSPTWDHMFGEVKFPFEFEQKFFGDRSEVHYLDPEIPATRVIEWADVVMNMGTSIVMEAVALRKPVISLDYLHNNVTVTAKFLEKSGINCRDDIFNIMHMFRTDRQKTLDEFYEESEWNRFVAAFLGHGDVLQKYSDFLVGEMEVGKSGET